jgi:hypothetical protein
LRIWRLPRGSHLRLSECENVWLRLFVEEPKTYDEN